MPNKTLILYASVDGQTADICGKIRGQLEEAGHLVEILTIQDPPPSIKAFDKIIMASSIRYGKHNAELISFIDENLTELNRLKTAFLSVNLVARKENKAEADTNPYVKKFFENTDWKPDMVGVFAGKLDYAKYSFWDKWLIRMIMFFTDGPLFPPIAMEFTNWQKVEAFSRDFSKL
ncbi:menaquinone-dependent protoporphyrinogen IX dehydrogenase [Litoribacter alkaliphilus]|uniref:Protoporphyrinogen IX dehydrogenase [quinone] n=1 Tax=Litoribacter ruber TaxID=702568 RepID=A0AAP2G0Q4_9BACT|nr:menaquinone-dependent protoporphyrinogen IX dehydrogenase [Litoribacter alkaliphilus]MBS9523249.1 menaquinone-dependent protoporphyrinogen IX dehydrogenase [Litoribacter alkaliphilus]